METARRSLWQIQIDMTLGWSSDLELHVQMDGYGIDGGQSNNERQDTPSPQPSFRDHARVLRFFP